MSEGDSELRDSVGREFSSWMEQLPGVAPEIEAASQRVRRSSRVFGQMLMRIATEYGLTIGDWETLSVLQRTGSESSPKKLAGELGVTSGTMSVRIERLIRFGFVEQVRNLEDGRGRPVRLTETGSATWRSATERRTAQEERLLTNALDYEEITHLNDLLCKLLTELEREFGPAPSHGSLRREIG